MIKTELGFPFRHYKGILINTAWNGFCKGKSILLPFY